MCVSRAIVALLLLAPAMGAISCDYGAPVEDRPLTQPQLLEVRSCPAEESLSWTFEFGLETDGVSDEEALVWPGGYFYSMSGQDGGVGGGGTGPRCGCSHGPCTCSFEPGQQAARRWKLSGEHEANLIPENFTVEIRGVNGHRPDLFEPDAVLLSARYELGEPEPADDAGCLTIPVRTVSVSTRTSESGQEGSTSATSIAPPTR